MVKNGGQTENGRKCQKMTAKKCTRKARRRFSAKVNFSHLIFYEDQKSEVVQDQPRHAIKVGVCEATLNSEPAVDGHLWPKMAKKAEKYVRNTCQFPTTYLDLININSIIINGQSENIKTIPWNTVILIIIK